MGYRLGSKNIALPHSVQTWILKPSWVLMGARVGSKITFEQPSTKTRLMDWFFKCCSVSTTISFYNFVRCPNPSFNIWPDNFNWNVRCATPLCFSNMLEFCTVSPPPNYQKSLQFSCQSSSTCISECGTPSSACFKKVSRMIEGYSKTASGGVFQGSFKGMKKF